MHGLFKETLWRRVFLLVSMAMLATTGSLASAQSAPTPSVDDLEEVIIEGRRVTEEMSTVAYDAAKFGSQVQVINSVEIDTGGFTNFGELASGLIRGANIGYSPDEGEFTIRIDGGSDRDTLLLLDGVPTFDRGTPLEDLWGATAIDPRMIESVEILRGGQSLYYGGNGGLGVVSVRYKEPTGEQKGEFGAYYGSFKTREVYGNVAYPLDDAGVHSVMFYGRSYESDAHEIFSKEAYNDVVLELGGRHDFPYTYNLIGGKYRWQINDETYLKAGYEFATVDFRDSFPNDHIFNLNYTEYPKFNAAFRTAFNDMISFEAEASLVYSRFSLILAEQVLTGAESKLLQKKLSLHPNPAQQKVSVYSPEAGELELINALGQKIKTQTILSGRNEVNLTGLPKGMYQLRLKGWSVEKLIVE